MFLVNFHAKDRIIRPDLMTCVIQALTCFTLPGIAALGPVTFNFSHVAGACIGSIPPEQRLPPR